MKVHQAGFPGVAALMGTVFFPQPQKLLLERFRRVILMLDGDESGRQATRRIAAQLVGQCSIQLVAVPAGRQPDQMTEEESREFLGAVLVGSQDASFAPAGAAAIVEPPPGAYSLAMGDVTGDGKPDILVGSRGGGVLFATGSNFPANPGKLVSAGCGRQSLAVADFDRDGLAGLAVYCWATGVVSILRMAGATWRLNATRAYRKGGRWVKGSKSGS